MICAKDRNKGKMCKQVDNARKGRAVVRERV
jgi:hypothetical protein